MKLTTELLRKHKDRLIEATTNVRAQVRTSTKGKKFNVVAHERDLRSMGIGELHAKRSELTRLSDKLSDSEEKALNKDKIKKALQYRNMRHDADKKAAAIADELKRRGANTLTGF